MSPTWRRYCEVIGLSMDEGVPSLITHEPETVVGSYDIGAEVFAEQVQRHGKERAWRLDARQRELDNRAEQLRKKDEHLRAWEHRLQTQRVAGGRVQGREEVGYNERCPCSSGLKQTRLEGLEGPNVEHISGTDERFVLPTAIFEQRR